MKKVVLVFLVFVLCLLSCTVAFAVSSIEEPASHDELIQLAQKEGKVVVYAVTSRFADVADKFFEKYGVKLEFTNVKDKEIITKVTTEIGGGTFGADVIIAHDTYRVYSELLQTGFVFTQVPNSLKTVIPERYQSPLVWLKLAKVFGYNTEFGEGAPFDNIWALTEPTWKDSVYLKDPNTEGGNFNWLTMLTSPEWDEKIAKAYEEYFGKPIELKDGLSASQTWIKAFMLNSVGNDSETSMAKDIATKGQSKQWAGWFSYSKFRALEDKSLYAIADNHAELKPFGAYLQPYYATLASNLQHPYAALLFLEFMYSEEGYAPWGEEVGSYTVVPTLPTGDGTTLDYWESIAVTDDPEFLAENRFDMEEFINSFYYR